MPTGALFNVACTLIVTSVPPVFVANLSGQGLRIEWSVQKTRTPTPDHATITVYNLARVTRAALAASSKIPGPVFVALAIGWDGLPEVVFSGEVWKMQAEQRTGVDVLSIIEAGDGAQPLRDTPPSGGSMVGVGIQLAVAQILGQLALTPSPAALAEISARAAAIPVQQLQLTGDGDLRDQLDQLLASIGLSWGISGQRFVVYAAGLRVDSPAVVLTPYTGLLRWEEIDDGGVSFEALAQPRLEPGGAVTVTDPFGKIIGGGPLRVEEITFQGASEGPSTMSGTARPVQVF